MKAVLLIGSPRGERSTSSSLGMYLLDQLGKRGWDVEALHIQGSMLSPEGIRYLVRTVEASKLLILSFPTYFDTVPAAMVRALELIAQRRKGKADRIPLVAMANCGSLEAEQNQVALGTCRLFARDAGFEWRGGLAMGGGPAIDGRTLTERTRMVRNARRSLEASATALSEGKELPEEAIGLMARRSAPRWLYIMRGNRGWRQQAKRNGVLDRMYDRPFTEENR